MRPVAKIETTGQLRAVLANAARDVLNGDLSIPEAMALHTLAKSIGDSLYNEAKIAMFARSAQQKTAEMGELRLGDPGDA